MKINLALEGPDADNYTLELGNVDYVELLGEITPAATTILFYYDDTYNNPATNIIGLTYDSTNKNVAHKVKGINDSELLFVGVSRLFVLL